MRPMHPCGNPACATLVRNGPNCPAHTITREMRNPKDSAQAKFYGSTQWKAIRKAVKARDPICKMCHRRPSTTAHHKDNDWTNNDPSNHEGACTECHNKHSGAEHWKKRAS